jgi:hypothetical protein
MTIAAGFCCHDGLVLCADTQITVAGSMKYPESKIRMSPTLQCVPFYAFCDDMDYQKQSIGHFNEAIRLAEQNRSNVISALEAKAVELHQTYYDLYADPGEKLNVNMLLSLRFGDRRKLFRINGPRVAPVEVLECIGAGNYLARALARTYWSDDMSIHQTSIVCAYILADCKKYVDGCGGDSHIIQLDHNGSWKIFPAEDDLEQIDDIEKGYDFWKEALSWLMSEFQDFERGQLLFESGLMDSCQKLIAQRKKKADFLADLERIKFEQEIAKIKEKQEGDS